jgi:hypothetical protein
LRLGRRVVWFPANQQPFEMSEDAFQSCFAGKAIVALA